MAKNPKYTNLRDTKGVLPRLGMNKDVDPQFIQEGQYTHAINAKMNNHEGKFSSIQNEPSTVQCLSTELPYISSAPLNNRRFVLFLGDETDSEIGIFDSSACTYTTVYNSPCLNFSKAYPPKAISQVINNCDEVIYIVDDNNPNRYINLNDVPEAEDCNSLLLNSIINVPCLDISVSQSGGKLPNGAYQVAIGYAEDDFRITDIYSVTNPVSLFSHQNFGGGVSVELSNIDTDFDQYIIYLIATVNAGTTVYQTGVYNTTQTSVEIGNINDLAIIDMSDVFVKSVIYKSSKDIVTVDDRAVWIGATTKPRINYQPLANKIRTKWAAYAVTEDYYLNGGKHVGYMRDEVYALGIQWLYDTGDWSEAYSILGPEAKAVDLQQVNNSDVYESYDPGCDPLESKQRWEIYNTAQGRVAGLPSSSCAEEVIGKGLTGFWQSEELYPTNTEVYGSLAGEKIRHHRMPSVDAVPYKIGDHRIILGLEFDNISHPTDCDGNLLTNIVGYRIVRADRVNHKSIQGKGLLFNMGEYDIPDTNNQGLYPNYPFNDLSEDNFLSKKLIQNNDGTNWRPATTFKKDLFTYHSPTFAGFDAKATFGTDLVIEGEMYGDTNTTYSPSYKHSKNVLMTDVSLALAYIIGVGGALLEGNEKRCIKLIADATGGSSVLIAQAWTIYEAALATAKLLPNPAKDLRILAARSTLVKTLAGLASSNVDAVGSNVSPGTKVTFEENICDTAFTKIPTILKGLNNVALFTYHFSIYAGEALDVIQDLVSPRNYVYQANAVGTYESFNSFSIGNRRRRIDSAKYIYPQVQRFNNQPLNNLNKESGVAISITREVNNPTVTDTSRRTMTQAGACDSKIYSGTASSHYASIRRKLPSQYGQIDSIRYVDTGYCETNLTQDATYSSSTVFGGDTYLNKYTLKRKQQYFTDTATDVGDNFAFDYSQYMSLPYVRYWMSTFKYEITDIVLFDFDRVPNLPSALNNLDCKSSGFFAKKDTYMYTSNNGVVDFLVESEYNLDLRDYDDRLGRRHYDENEHTDLEYIFRQDFYDIDNDHKYDISYSKGLTENSIIPQDKSFDCTTETTCHVRYDNRVFWSLPYQEGFTKDTWRTYLPNNYYDFPKEAGNLIATKPLDRNNIVFLMDQSSPWLITAQDTLSTDAGTKISIGDGGLFAQKPRPIVTTDTNYGAASSREAITNTQYGLFYVSAEQGKVFSMRGSKLEELNQKGMNFWLKENMPFKLTEQFSEVLQDNVLLGVGYTSVFDNRDEVYHISKRDYKLKDEFVGLVSYDSSTHEFTYNGSTIELSDETYFDDCSWNLSYNPRVEAWISFHDWHPDDTIQTDLSQLTVKNNIIYKHNETCDHYCYFYQLQHSFDLEYVINSGMQTATLSSIEYNLESYKYFNSCIDKHHLLDYNFNRAHIYNTEQTTGLLHLNLQAKNQMSQINNYPQIQTDYIDIEYAKVEQKYRFNQFWDVTKNRAEFNTNYINLLTTEPNGYNYTPNPDYINYQKPVYQRAKMRHNWNKIYLSREDDPQEMNQIIVKFMNNKNIISPR